MSEEFDPGLRMAFEQSMALIRERYRGAFELLAEGLDLAEVLADDVLLDSVGGADLDELRLLVQSRRPLTAMLAAWAAGVREEFS